MCIESVSLSEYEALRQQLVDLGYHDEIRWAETVQLVSDPLEFWREFAWVVLNSGMKNQVARSIWERVRPVVEGGGSASEAFGHKGKCAAIDSVFRNREQHLAEFLSATDRMEYLWGLPWIGEITRFHLAKNLGLNTSKPDRHLIRIAGAEGVQQMCERLARLSGNRVGTVDLVLWRASNLGLIDTKGLEQARAQQGVLT